MKNVKENAIDDIIKELINLNKIYYLKDYYGFLEQFSDEEKIDKLMVIINDYLEGLKRIEDINIYEYNCEGIESFFRYDKHDVYNDFDYDSKLIGNYTAKRLISDGKKDYSFKDVKKIYQDSMIEYDDIKILTWIILRLAVIYHLAS